MRALRLLVCTLLVAALVSPATSPARSTTRLPVPGTVVRATPMDRSLWIPDVTRKAFRLTYVTLDARGRRALSTGAVFIPRGTAPVGGWPMVSWAHGTVGIGDDCAPSRLPRTARDATYLATWMRQGYAVVATDYVGLGTPGLQPYLHGRAAAHNLVDMVAAGRAFTSSHLPVGQRLARRWVAIGQSQGGGAAIYTARFASEYGGSALDFRGAVGTGTPAYIEHYIGGLGNKIPPVALPGALTAFLSYALDGFRDARPDIGLDGILTETGKKYLDLAKTLCLGPLAAALDGVSIGDFFTSSVGALPGAVGALKDYMGMPETGFHEPFFIGHGMIDLAVPPAFTVLYASNLQAGGQPVTFKTYPADHSGTMAASLPDTVPFVRRLLR